jgi:ribonuclease T1
VLGLSALAREPATPIPDVAAAELPPEARDTLALIRTGGPFPYRRDGTIFRNFERRLPVKGRGYYREYTVPTPGAPDRGARRIVAGAGGDVRTSGEYYYTDDHYATFRRIRE